MNACWTSFGICAVWAICFLAAFGGAVLRGEHIGPMEAIMEWADHGGSFRYGMGFVFVHVLIYSALAGPICLFYIVSYQISSFL